MPPVWAQPCVGDEALLADGVHSGLPQGWEGGGTWCTDAAYNCAPPQGPPGQQRGAHCPLMSQGWRGGGCAGRALADNGVQWGRGHRGTDEGELGGIRNKGGGTRPEMGGWGCPASALPGS